MNRLMRALSAPSPLTGRPEPVVTIVSVLVLALVALFGIAVFLTDSGMLTLLGSAITAIVAILGAIVSSRTVTPLSDPVDENGKRLR